MRLGIDIGGSKIAAALIDESGSIIQQIRRPSDRSADSKQFISLLFETVNTLCPKRSQISFCGVGYPGSISRQGHIISSPNLPMLIGLPLKNELEKLLSVAVAVDNDANCAALAELKFGALQNAGQAILLTLGTGIGGGIICNGELYRGVSGTAGEVGHMIIHPNGRPCSCGNKGCWEKYASAKALTALLRKQAMADPNSILWQIACGNIKNIGAHCTEAALKKDDQAAVIALEEYLEELSTGISNLCCLFDPQIIAIGGGLSALYPYFAQKLQTLVKQKVYSGDAWQGKLIKARFGNNAGLIGAAFLS